MKLLQIVILIAVVASCSVDDLTGGEDGDDGGGGGSSSEEIPTGALEVSGTLANEENPDDTSVLDSQTVELVRNDGVVVGTATSDANGAYAMELPAGALVVDTEFDLLDDDADKASVKDFSYNIEAKAESEDATKALGIRKKVELGEVKEGSLALGETPLKEVSALIGSVSFESGDQTVDSVDVFIPGEQFFVRTGDDGKFVLFFTPVGTYDLRLQKGNYKKDVEVTVEAGVTTNLGEISIAETDRDPLPLATTLVGTWSSTCYYSDIATSVDPDSPTTGTITVTSLTSLSVSGKSCIMRTEAAAGGEASEFRTVGDGGIISKTTGGNFHFNLVLEYSANRIVIDVEDSGLPGDRIVEILERQ